MQPRLMHPRLSMKSMLAVLLLLVAAETVAQAQMSGTANPTGVETGPVTIIPNRPGLQTSADNASAIALRERLSLQSDLVWVGQYNGAITGEVSERMVAAIKRF